MVAITPLLLEEIAEESIRNGEVDINREGDTTTISTNAGTLLVRQSGVGNVGLLFVSIDLDSSKRVFEGNERMSKKYKGLLEKKGVAPIGYLPLPLYQENDLPFSVAYELANYILSTILRKEHKARRMIN